MVTALAPSLLAFFPLFLLAATVFFEAESRRISKLKRPGQMLASASAYFVVVVCLVGSLAMTLFALVRETNTPLWGNYFGTAILLGVVGTGVYLAASVYVVLGRLIRSASVLRDAKRMREGKDIRDGKWLWDKSIDGWQLTLTVISLLVIAVLLVLISAVLPLT